jgi:hypothetical protein
MKTFKSQWAYREKSTGDIATGSWPFRGKAQATSAMNNTILYHQFNFSSFSRLRHKAGMRDKVSAYRQEHYELIEVRLNIAGDIAQDALGNL